MNKTLALGAAVAALFSLPAVLTAASADRGARAFAKADKNNDGKLNKEEFAAMGAGKTDQAKADKAFARRDKDNDGFLSKEEFAAAAAAAKKKDGDPGATEKKRKKDK